MPGPPYHPRPSVVKLTLRTSLTPDIQGSLSDAFEFLVPPKRNLLFPPPRTCRSTTSLIPPTMSLRRRSFFPSWLRGEKYLLIPREYLAPSSLCLRGLSVQGPGMSRAMNSGSLDGCVAHYPGPELRYRPRRSGHCSFTHSIDISIRPIALTNQI